MHYASEEEENWRVKNVGTRCHQHQLPKSSFPFVKLPSFNGESDPNVYFGWEAKVEQVFNVYEVEDEQKVKLASLEFLNYAMQWWHQVIKNISLNKRPIVVSWYTLKNARARGLFLLIIGRNCC